MPSFPKAMVACEIKLQFSFQYRIEPQPPITSLFSTVISALSAVMLIPRRSYNRSYNRLFIDPADLFYLCVLTSLRHMFFHQRKSVLSASSVFYFYQTARRHRSLTQRLIYFSAPPRRCVSLLFSFLYDGDSQGSPDLIWGYVCVLFDERDKRNQTSF